MTREHSENKSASQMAREEIADMLGRGHTLTNHDLAEIFDKYGINGKVATNNLCSVIVQQLPHHTGQKVARVYYRGRSIYADPILLETGLCDLLETQLRIDKSIEEQRKSN